MSEKIILPAFLLCFFLGCVDVPSSAGSQDGALDGSPSSLPSATVWYLGHAGFAVKVDHKLLIFDYVPKLGTTSTDADADGLDDGYIRPSDLEGLEVFVFVSHHHGDHYHREIFTWKNKVKKIHYFFGWLGTWEAENYPDHHHMAGPRATAEVDGVRVFTVNSKADGIPEVAYLVEVDGLWLYHNGDHFTQDDEDLEYLAQITSGLEMAFVTNATGDEGRRLTEKVIRFLERFQPRVVFPMHRGFRGGEEEAHEEFAEMLTRRGMTLDVRLPRVRGDRFEVEW
jgi:L-ascorbate metabolism protein UlaG (beta-lactamase superfamily)